MKLRTKLFLGVTALFLMMIASMYLLPAFFVRKDVNDAADKIHTLLVKEERKLIDSRERWISNSLNHMGQNINSLLYTLYENPEIIQMVTFNEGRAQGGIFEALATISGFDPDIGFVQAHAPQKKKTAVVSPREADLLPIKTLAEYEDIVLFGSLETSGETTLFAGLKLPEAFQQDAGFTLYALLDPKKVTKEKSELASEIKDLDLEGLKTQLQKIPHPYFAGDVNAPSSIYWALKIELMRTLAPLIYEGLQIGEIALVPEGIGRIDTSGSGAALLSQNAFHTESFFDDTLYYDTHLPEEGAPPLAKGTVFVALPENKEAYIVNTLKTDETYISIGFPLLTLIQKLALSSNKIILMQLKGLWYGVDSEGKRLPPTWIEKLVDTGLDVEKRGIVTIDQESFFYVRLDNLDFKDLVMYELHPQGGKSSIFLTLDQLEEALSSKISLQLALLMLITMAIILLVIIRMGVSVIKPITQLAEATKYVVAGQYDEVELPEVGKRRDEVATLTRSFAGMVSGLQDREKIRGVLDKVVSKDIADEILRTQIHLGGEDRIVTMLFSDIRDFSELTENTTPQKTIEMLNGCMTKISRVIEGEGGVIDKYVGDEVMAIFGAPTSHPDHALRAISSGLLMIETLKLWNQERKVAGESIMEMGIGIHTGLVVAGNMGAEDRLNYTVLGANVNLASRLCQVAKPNQLIISEATLAEPNIEESFFVKPLQSIVLKGFKEPVMVYEVIGFKWDET